VGCRLYRFRPGGAEPSSTALGGSVFRTVAIFHDADDRLFENLKLGVVVFVNLDGDELGVPADVDNRSQDAASRNDTVVFLEFFEEFLLPLLFFWLRLLRQHQKQKDHRQHHQQKGPCASAAEAVAGASSPAARRGLSRTRRGGHLGHPQKQTVHFAHSFPFNKGASIPRADLLVALPRK